MLEFSDLWPYWVCFCSLLGTGIPFMPIPEELPIVGAGAWTAGAPEQYDGYRWLMLPICFLGVVVSDFSLYFVGRKFGRRILKTRIFARLLPPKKQLEIEENFHKHGIKVLLFARFLPGIRSPVFIMAGVMKLPMRRFIVADAIYAIPGVCLLFYLGYHFRNQAVELVDNLDKGPAGYIKPAIVLLVLLGVVGYMLYKLWKRPVATGDPADVPIVPAVTEAPGIRQVTNLIDGPHPEMPPPEELPVIPPPENNGQVSAPAADPARKPAT